eukprot:297821-Prymnesium_polylepis.1
MRAVCAARERSCVARPAPAAHSRYVHMAAPPPPPSGGSQIAPFLARDRAAIDACFAADSIEEIEARLQRDGGEWGGATLATLGKMSPTSLKVTACDATAAATARCDAPLAARGARRVAARLPASGVPRLPAVYAAGLRFLRGHPRRAGGQGARAARHRGIARDASATGGA